MKKIYLLKNIKTNEKFKIVGENKVIAFCFLQVLSNWEMESKAFNDYCEKYSGTTKNGILEYDRHLEELEKMEKEEFKKDYLNITEKYSPFWKIVKIKVENEEEERVM